MKNFIKNILDFFNIPDYECPYCGEIVSDCGPEIIHKCSIKNIIKKILLEIKKD